MTRTQMPMRFLRCALVLLLSLLAPLAASAEPETASGFLVGPPDARGLLPVIEIFPGSPAHLAGARVEDWIFEVDGIRTAGLLPEAVEAQLSKRLAGGWSVVVVVYRQGTREVLRLRPVRISRGQREMLVFRRAFSNAAQDAEAAWRRAMDALDASLFGGLSLDGLDRVLFELYGEFRAARGAVASVPLGGVVYVDVAQAIARDSDEGSNVRIRAADDSAVSPRAYAQAVRAQILFARAQMVRENALSLVRKFVVAHGERDAKKAKLRWQELDDAQGRASRLEADARTALLDALSLAAHPGDDLTEILLVETGAEERFDAPEIGIVAVASDAPGFRGGEAAIPFVSSPDVSMCMDAPISPAVGQPPAAPQTVVSGAAPHAVQPVVVPTKTPVVRPTPQMTPTPVPVVPTSPDAARKPVYVPPAPASADLRPTP